MTELSILERLILKFSEGALSDEESKKLDTLLLDKKNARFFKDTVQDEYLLHVWKQKTDTNASLTKTLAEIQVDQKRSWRFSKEVYRYAAAAVILFGLASFWYASTLKEKPGTSILVSDNKIELLLANGQKQFIHHTDKDSIKGDNNVIIGYLNKGKLSYSEDNTNELVYNTLYVPYGKQFELVLSDGTSINLNAGTTLRYPVSFLKGQSREVFLEGEAYFDVAHDAEHKFVVNASNLNVTVLGTEFNVSSYTENRNITTTLVDGSVQIHNDSQEINNMVLIPNEQSIWDKDSKTISKVDVNTNIYTSWRNGQLIFRGEPFTDIAKKLERAHDIVITGYDTDLGEETFTAKFKNESIEQIIHYFSDAYGFDYTVNGNKIIITMK